MKSKLFDASGKEKGNVDLPKCFSESIREDIVAKVLETKKVKQPYSPSPIAGKQKSASGNLQHRRSVWKTTQGKGISKVPRKIMTRRGSQFNWVGAEIPNARGGRRAHPPKIESMINTKKINKKEMEIALKSALSATANEKIVGRKYKRLEGKNFNVPFVVEEKILSLKTKEFIESIKKMLGSGLFEVALKEKKVRSGVGKLRGRKYKRNAGMLLVFGNDEKITSNIIDAKNVKSLNVADLAEGGMGRLTVYTEKALSQIGEKLK